MTLDQIRARITALVKLGGWSNTTPSPDYTFLANEGLRLLTLETQHNIESITVVTVVNQVEYDLTTALDTRRWITLFDDAIYNTGTYLPQTTRDKLRAEDRLWTIAAAGTPKYWYWYGPNSIGLWPKPSSASINVTFNGARHETVLTAGTDEPTINGDFHEAICLLGAWYHGKSYARGEEKEVLMNYREEAYAYIERYRGMTGSQEAGMLVRRVNRPLFETLEV